MSKKTNVNYWVVLYELIRVQVTTVFYFGLIYFSFALLSESGQEFEAMSDLFSLIIIVVFSAIIAIPISFLIAFPPFIMGFFVSVYLIEKRVKTLYIWVVVSTLIGSVWGLYIEEWWEYSTACSFFIGIFMWRYAHLTIIDEVKMLEDKELGV